MYFKKDAMLCPATERWVTPSECRAIEKANPEGCYEVECGIVAFKNIIRINLAPMVKALQGTESVQPARIPIAI